MDRLEERYLVARLIAREIAGNPREEETRWLEEWKAASGKNRREYERVTRRLAREIPGREGLDAEREWGEFEREIIARRVTRRRRRVAVVAAAVVAGVVMAGAYLSFPVGERDEAPGAGIVKRHAAVLVIDGGERVMISGDSRGVIHASGGARVVARDNRLLYEEVDGETPAGRHVLTVPRGGEYELVLPDGTRAWLNSGSRVEFPGRFDGATREVKMQGEVCFDVAPRAGQPFIVKTGEVTLRVLGTLFNVEAYPGEPVVATLVNGSLRLSAGTREELLHPGQRATVDDGKVLIEETRAAGAVDWTRGFLTFTDTSLDVIMKRLARWYDVEVEYLSPRAGEARFTVEIKRYDNIASVLSKIEMTGRVRFSIDGNRVLVEE
ncbi:MAG: DUF4974 domain-containing protein [Odoribacteraceae bacterium]|jgi:ferric-dicitrate binding protein FerR (iron transport regulator)|nr:DUF4974 domain-containing protein [Odoribacteraceae bacterium]